MARIICATLIVILVQASSVSGAEYPILFVNGICSESSTWNTMFDNLPRQRFGEELVKYYQGDAGGVQLKEDPLSGSQRSFTIDFYDSTNNTFDSRTVADIPIVDKVGQLKAVIDKIKVVTGSPKVIIISHSMGGLVARSYVQSWGLNSAGQPIAYENDIAGVITIDTPHQGADLAVIPFDLTDWDTICLAAATVNKAEMSPQSEFLEVINNRPWPDKTRLDAIISYCLVLVGPDSDGFVSRESQDIETISDYWANHTDVQSHPQRFCITLLPELPNLILHSATLRSRVTASLVQGIVEEIDRAALDLTTIGGRVFDAANPRLLSGVTVEVVETGAKVTTNGDGRYQIGGIGLTTFTVRYSHPNYRTVERVYTFQPGSENLNIDVGLNPNGIPIPQYDGSWTGSGRGNSSASTPATVEISFQVAGDQVRNLIVNWRVDTVPGTKESLYCSGRGGASVPLVGSSFTMTGSQQGAYRVSATGTFASANSVNGTVTLERTSAGASWCQSATVNWSGKKQ